MHILRHIGALLLVGLLASPALAQDLLIQNATVLTVTNGTLENSDILVRDGKIARIGEGLSAPNGAAVIDATDHFVMPGIIDAHSHIAIDGVNEATNPVVAEVSMEDVLDPFDIGLYRALAGGVTTSHVMHGSANPIGGQCETIKHRYGVHNPDALKMIGAPRTIKFALGENPTRVHGNRGINPSTRMGVEMVIRDAFEKGKRYMEAHEAYAQERRRNPRAVPPAYDLRLQTMADIITGDIIIQAHSYRSDEILMLMDVVADYGVDRMTFQHVNEGFKVAPELAAFGVEGAGASIFADWWAYKFEVYYSTAYNAAILTRNGVVTSINSDSGELNRHLYHEAAKTQRYGGLTDDEALALITINPAKQLGIADRVGSIEVGKDADLAIFNAHPLSVYAIAQYTIVDGDVRFDLQNDADDMRLVVNPEENIDSAVLWQELHDRCMQGTEFMNLVTSISMMNGHSHMHSHSH
ncbi:MAG: amidohydrolase family protein [Bacteroidota bacterium]